VPRATIPITPAASPEGGQHTTPMCDAYIPEGRTLAWVFVHRHEMCIAGAAARAPHYRFVCQVPESQYNDKRRAVVTAAMTQAVVEAEDASWPDPERRARRRREAELLPAAAGERAVP
jgi:predicted esterase